MKMGRFYRTSIWFAVLVFVFFTCAFEGTGACAAATSGSLIVTINPPLAVTSGGARWQVDGGNWQNSGIPLSGLLPGKHTLAFSTISGWTTPPSQSVTISAGATKKATGTYKEITGSLSVTITPSSAVKSGAEWQVDSGAWQKSGAKVTVQTTPSTTQHSVTFKTTVPNNWTAPQAQSVTIAANNATKLTVAYGPAIASLSKATAAPFTLLTITGSGFDTTTDISVRFSNSSENYLLEVPVVAVTSTTVTVSVPPFVLSTGAYGAGTADVQVVQRSKTSTAVSNSITGSLSIQDLPTPVVQTGAVTLSLIQANITAATKLQTDIQATSLNTKAITNALSAQITAMQSLASSVQTLMGNPTGSFEIGTLKGTPVNITYSDLQSVDRLVLGMVSALANGQTQSVKACEDNLLSLPTGGSDDTSACMQAESSSYAQGTQDGDSTQDQLNQLMTTDIYAPRSSVLCAVPAAFDTALKIVGGAGAVALGVLLLPEEVSAMALALPAAALLYATVGTAGGEIMVGGALGQTSKAAAALVQNGVKQFEDLMEDKVVDTFIPESVGTLKSIAQGLYDLTEGFMSAPAPSPPASSPPSAGTYLLTYYYNTSSVTCCDDQGDCYTVPGISSSGSYSIQIPAGVSTKLLGSELCPYVEADETSAGCVKPSCSFSSTSNSFTLGGSCTAPPTPGCTTETASETITATKQ